MEMRVNQNKLFGLPTVTNIHAFASVEPYEHKFSLGRSHRLPAPIFRALKARRLSIQNQLFQTPLHSKEIIGIGF